ncbi:hypothetical protein Q8A67_017123 [Cirrhinus molitorella]|uniref:Uncharacterized protein n=1 Tax=Cirrhinus molitorella TaxID=172907 RepID=A0AA88PDI7_9TELE|nr:hypothetical protein Q8A67_017123 [Cirrhinus molitorella]
MKVLCEIRDEFRLQCFGSKPLMRSVCVHKSEGNVDHTEQASPHFEGYRWLPLTALCFCLLQRAGKVGAGGQTEKETWNIV